MPFKREENFKMDLSKCLKFLNIATKEDEAMKINPQKWLAQRQFRTHVLLNQDNRRTEAINTFCEGKKMLATFERIRREMEDLHLAYVCGKFDPHIIPVAEYTVSSSNSTGKLGKIRFRTQRGKERRMISMEIKEAPGSAVFKDATRNMTVKFGVDCKVDENKLRSHIYRLMVSGDLFIDFITKTFWKFLDDQVVEAAMKKAQLEKAEKIREAIAAKQQEAPVEKVRPRGLGGLADKKYKEFGSDGHQKSHQNPSSYHSNRSFAGTDPRRPFGSSNNSFPSSGPFRNKDHKGPNAIPRVGQRDHRDHKDFRENRDNRGEIREFRERRNSREPPRGNRDHRDQFRDRDNNQRVSTHRGVPENRPQLLGFGSSNPFQSLDVRKEGRQPSMDVRKDGKPPSMDVRKDGKPPSMDVRKEGRPPSLMTGVTRGGSFGGGMKRGQSRGGPDSKQWRDGTPRGARGESGGSAPGKE